MSSLLAVVPDANVLIALCVREADKVETAESATHETELVTFDKGFINQAAKNAARVKVNLLPV